MVQIRWLTAFLDAPRHAPGAEELLPFWQQVTATRLSSRRGKHQEFATLLPADGDPFLRTQDIDGGPPGCHLDLHVRDVRAAVDQAVESGAGLVADRGTLVVARSPAGFPFCLVAHRQGVQRPTPVRFSSAGAQAGSFGSLLDQVCIDVPAALFDTEVTWWSRLSGWLQRPGSAPEFAFLERPAGLPLRLLFQRLPQRHAGQDTMLDPVGRPYCITDRDRAPAGSARATGTERSRSRGPSGRRPIASMPSTVAIGFALTCARRLQARGCLAVPLTLTCR